MITATGRYISNGLTETGQLVIGAITETGDSVFGATSAASYTLLLTGGAVVGGSCVYSQGYSIQLSGGFVVGGTLPMYTVHGMHLSGGFILGADMVKKQIPYDLFISTAPLFGLTDASTNFKLEQQP